MNIKFNGKTYQVGGKKLTDLRSQIDHLQRRVKNLSRVQMSRSYSWTGTDDESEKKAYTGNRYRTYDDAMTAIAKKYANEDDFGCVLLGNIVDIRSALITGQGLDIDTDPKASPWSIEFMNEYKEANKIEGVTPVNYSKESELEGRYLVKIRWDKNHVWTTTKPDKKGKRVERKGMIKLVFLTWLRGKYKVETDSEDYQKYTKVIFDKKGVKALSEQEFVYAKLGGRIDKPNDPVPKVWRVLTNLEDIDMALSDTRLLNHLFSGPVADVQCETMQDVEDVAESMPTNFRKGQFFVHLGEFNFKSPEMSGAESLFKEATIKAKVVSGATGVPIHYIGFADVMSNRSTAESLVDSLNASTTIERETSQDVWNEIIRKSILMYNEVSQKTKIDPNLFKAKINIVTAEQWERIEKIFLPAREKNLISARTFYEKIPGMNADDELKKINDEADRELSAYKASLGKEERVNEKLALEKSKKSGAPEKDEEESDG